MRLPFLLLLILGPLCSFPLQASASNGKDGSVIAKDAKVIKAAYVYNFTKFIDWPGEEGGEAPMPPITICVLGNDPVGSQLDEIKALTAKGRPIVVVHIKPEEAIPPCHILYICLSEHQRLARIMARVEKKGILTVSDLPGFAEQGGMIGFTSERGRVLVEINAPLAQRAGLKVSSKLLEIARIVPRRKS